MELGWKSYVDNYESWSNWKNCHYDWDVESGLTLSGHCCLGSIRNSGNFSSQNCTFEHKDCYGALKRPHSWVPGIFVAH